MIKTLTVFLAVMMSGCSFTLTTPDVPLDAPPRSAPKLSIGVRESDIDVPGTDEMLRYKDFRRDLYSTLISSAPNGQIAPFTNQKLYLFPALKFKAEDSGIADIFIGVLSLFLPPLAFVPYNTSEDYSVQYMIRNQEGRIIFAQSQPLAGKVGGYIQGYYVGRPSAFKSLHDAEAQSAARNAARLVLNDIFTHASEIAAAAQNLSEEALERPEPESDAPVVGKPATGAPWWQTQ